MWWLKKKNFSDFQWAASSLLVAGGSQVRLFRSRSCCCILSWWVQAWFCLIDLEIWLPVWWRSIELVYTAAAVHHVCTACWHEQGCWSSSNSDDQKVLPGYWSHRDDDWSNFVKCFAARSLRLLLLLLRRVWELSRSLNLFVWFLTKLCVEVTCWMITGERQAARIRSNYLKAILRQDIAFFDKETSTGEVIGRMAGDTVLIQEAIGEKVGKFQQLVSTFLGGFVVAFIRGWKLTLVMLAVLPALVLATTIMAKLLSRLSSEGQRCYAEAGNTVQQVVSSIRTVSVHKTNNHQHPWSILSNVNLQIFTFCFTWPEQTISVFGDGLQTDHWHTCAHANNSFQVLLTICKLCGVTWQQFSVLFMICRLCLTWQQFSGSLSANY